MTTRGRLGKTASSALIFATLGYWVTSVCAAQATPLESSEPQQTDWTRLTETSGVDPGLSLSTDMEQVTSVVEIASSVKDTDITTEQAVSATHEVGTITPTDSLIESEEAFEDTNVQDLAQALPDMEQESDSTVPDPLFVDPLDAVEESDPMGQVTSVSQLRDVSPGDWAYEALRSLVERYGCIAGYPDGTFRGNRALTRYEFAAGLNACLQQIERLIGNIPDNGDDFTTLRRLIEEFEAELATLGARVDNLEGRVAFLEDNQFSTTTKLSGEVIFGLADAFGDDVGDDVNTVFHDRVRLNFLTSFTGKDMLQTRLQAGNAALLLARNGVTFDDGSGGSQEGRFTYDGDNGNDVIIDILRYRFPLGDKATVQIVANNGLHHYYSDTVNPYLEGAAGGSNAISRFAERNPIYRIGPFGAGAAIALKPSDNLRVDLGYISNTASNPGDDNGLFNGNYSGIAQIVYGSRFKIGLTYIHAYDDGSVNDGDDARRFLLGGTGTAFANLNPGQLATITNLSADTLSTPVVSNSYGLEASLRFSPRFLVNGWVGKTDARLIGLGDADIWNFAVGLVFPDLGKEGNLAAIVAGAEPTLRGLDVPGGTNNFNRDFAYHIEGFYKYQVSDNLSITPGIIWLTAPNQNSDNSDAVIGTVRTTFTF